MLNSSKRPAQQDKGSMPVQSTKNFVMSILYVAMLALIRTPAGAT